jgi:hypothetical protein
MVLVNHLVITMINLAVDIVREVDEQVINIELLK